METKVYERCGREFPIENFKVTRWGTHSKICNDCVQAKCRETKEKSVSGDVARLEEELKKARQLRIHEFTPRELIEELKRRGYTGKLEYVETHVIDMENF